MSGDSVSESSDLGLSPVDEFGLSDVVGSSPGSNVSGSSLGVSDSEVSVD